MDNDFRIDLAEVERTVRDAEIITLFFPILRKTLLTDTRYDVEDEPMVRVVPMVSGPDERLRTIRKLRPNFPKPERIAFIPWPKYASSLVRLGVYDTLRERLERSGRRKPLDDLLAALHALEAMERAELAAVFSGEGYRTLWQREGE
ncbi:MAG: hypothetical protein O3B84_05060 [Chloroflexi bacterium]|nr:hypothetical protein [Chloroflexota bacterium]